MFQVLCSTNEAFITGTIYGTLSTPQKQSSKSWNFSYKLCRCPFPSNKTILDIDSPSSLCDLLHCLPPWHWLTIITVRLVTLFVPLTLTYHHHCATCYTVCPPWHWLTIVTVWLVTLFAPLTLTHHRHCVTCYTVCPPDTGVDPPAPGVAAPWCRSPATSPRYAATSKRGIVWLIDWLIDWLTDWLVDWLIGWLIEWLIDLLTYWFTSDVIMLCSYTKGYTVKSYYFVGYLITWNSWARGSTKLSTHDIKSPRLDFQFTCK